MYSKIMVPLDGSTASEEALAAARYLARTGSGEIELVRVQSLPPDLGMNPEYRVPLDVLDRQRQRCLDYLEKVSQQLSEDGYRCRCTVLRGGDCGRIIARAAADSGSDIIVLTSHGRTGFKRALLGSIAERVARLAPCPVMIVGHHSSEVARSQARTT